MSGRRSGIAPIKAEFLVSGVGKREIDLSHVSTADKQQLVKSEKRENDGDGDGDLKDGGSKNKRMRGQNKHRKNEMWRERQKNKPTIRICNRFVAGGDDAKLGCSYGDKCSFSHDVQAYFAAYPKKDDINGTCYVFQNHGYCSHGALCRFSSGHTNADKTNVIESEKWSEWEPKIPELSKNTLKKDVQVSLRKRTYDFSKANTIHEDNMSESRVGPVIEIVKKPIDFRGKLYLSPLTTVGNLPFRRIAKTYGADITCGEMAMAQNLLEGQQSEWALLRRHASEDIFGVQICGAHADMLTRACQMIRDNCEVNFVDLNMGCPIDIVYKRGAGSGLMGRMTKLNHIIDGMYQGLGDIPLTIKMRTGIADKKNIATKVIESLKEGGSHRVALYSVHGRSREARYTKTADWDYIRECSKVASPTPLFGSGDVMSYEDLDARIKTDSEEGNIAGALIARGALIKPWVFTELKERRHWDISSSERFDMLKKYTNYGLEHWGSDDVGVEKTRRFLLEWVSFLHRYIPVGLLEVIPQKINERPLVYHGRDDLETMMSSTSCNDWVKLSEMLLGPVPDNFSFIPKHKANAYAYRDEGECAPCDTVPQVKDDILSY